jgi:hypothetical protein
MRNEGLFKYFVDSFQYAHCKDSPKPSFDSLSQKDFEALFTDYVLDSTHVSSNLSMADLPALLGILMKSIIEKLHAFTQLYDNSKNQSWNESQSFPSSAYLSLLKDSTEKGGGDGDGESRWSNEVVSVLLESFSLIQLRGIMRTYLKLVEASTAAASSADLSEAANASSFTRLSEEVLTKSKAELVSLALGLWDRNERIQYAPSAEALSPQLSALLQSLFPVKELTQPFGVSLNTSIFPLSSARLKAAGPGQLTAVDESNLAGASFTEEVILIPCEFCSRYESLIVVV